jgi:hypothetical protein
MAQWVPNVAESNVLKREDTWVTVEQRGVAKYGTASFPYASERKIESEAARSYDIPACVLQGGGPWTSALKAM